MDFKLRLLGVIAAVFSFLYLIWLGFAIEHPLGWVFFIAESAVASMLFLNVINLWTQLRQDVSEYPATGTLDVFLTVVDEPLSLFEKTLAAAVKINYEDKQIYILDDGGRDAVRQLARHYGVTYISREDRPRHHKAGNLNAGLEQSEGEFILVVDADQVVKPTIVEALLGHFHEPQVAIVTTRQAFTVPASDFNNDYLFYGHDMPGRNADNAAISCGSGVFYRRTALKEIGGFQTWNIVEDLYTTYVLHGRGYKSVYVDQSYSKGLAPFDLPTIHKQRGTWATDALRIFYWKNPVLQSGLNIRQKMHYFDMCWRYLVAAVFFPFFFLFVSLSVAFNFTFVANADTYLLVRIPSVFLIYFYYYLLSNKTMSGIQAFIALFPVFIKSTVLALGGNKPAYVVTNKQSRQRQKCEVDPAAFGVVVFQCRRSRLPCLPLWLYGPGLFRHILGIGDALLVFPLFTQGPGLGQWF